MKRFDLAEYLENPKRKVVTADGRNVRIVCTDANRSYPIIALVKEQYNDKEEVHTFTKNGLWKLSANRGLNDLFFAPEKHEGWFNIYHSDESGFYVRQNHPYKSQDEADEIAKANPKTFFTTVKIEWEE